MRRIGCLLLWILSFAISTPRLVACSSPQKSNVRAIVSANDGDRLSEYELNQVEPDLNSEHTIIVNEKQTFQTIDGFGASFNEAGIVVLNVLAPDTQEAVLRSVFDPRAGAGFSIMKSPIAATDFASSGPWFSYAETPNDRDLLHFSTARDFGPAGVGTFVERSRTYGNFQLQATMDFPPDWMLDEKQNLKRKNYSSLSTYFIKYIEAYKKRGIIIDVLSPFNEPGIYTRITYPEIGTFIKTDLGPRLKKSKFPTRLQISDAPDRHVALKEFPPLMIDEKLSQYISSLAFHGYFWEQTGSEPLSALHQLIPNTNLWQTEVCRSRPPSFEFEDGEYWGNMIISDLRNYASAWLYWNLILNQEGGPWLVSPEHRDPDGNQQHPLIIINADTREITYTGAYYYLAHFSKFVRPGAIRIQSTGEIKGIQHVAFLAPDGSKVLNVINSNSTNETANLLAATTAIKIRLKQHSISTFIW